MRADANVIEIFSSIQGEGKYVGCRQVFVRFAGCNVKCKYCDTIDSTMLSPIASIEVSPGSRRFKSVNNPITAVQLLGYITNLYNNKHHSVSFTGGEPLCHSALLSSFLPMFTGVKYLETNGTLPDDLEKVLPYIDIISMDIKLPSAAGKSYWEEHRRFLHIAKQREVFVKIVISGETSDEEFDTAIQMVANVDKKVTVILQPVTPINGCLSVTPDKILFMQDKASTQLYDVRVIPQTHKYIGQL